MFFDTKTETFKCLSKNFGLNLPCWTQSDHIPASLVIPLIYRRVEDAASIGKGQDVLSFI